MMETQGTPLELRYLDPETLAPQAENPWEHGEAQRAALAAVLDEAGWAGAAVYNLETERLVDGHLRREEAMRRGEALPVLCGRWSEEQERLLLATINPIALLAQENAARLEALRAQVRADLDTAGLPPPPGLEELLAGWQPPDWGAALGALPDGDRDGIQEMTFTVSDGQAEEVKRAILAAKRAGPFGETGNPNGNGNALARICGTFLSTHGAGEGD